MSSVAGETGRTAKQVEADIMAAENAIPNQPMSARLNPLFRRQMIREIAPSLQRLVQLFEEFKTVHTGKAEGYREEECIDLAMLAVYGKEDALQLLEDAAASPTTADAVAGKVGLMMVRWWATPDAAAQRGIVGEFEPLARANPQDDVLVGAALSMARYQSQADDLSSQLRDIVDHDLTGPAADRYQNQPYKLGRPFKISIEALGGKEVSTTDWKGNVVIVDFWATWCPPCRAALPELIQLYDDDHGKGLEVLGISNDSSLDDLKNFLGGHRGMVWPESFNPTGRDGWNALSPKMGVRGIPTSFLIDRNGILRDIEVAYLDKELLDKLLEEKSNPSVMPAPAAAPTASVAGDDAATAEKRAQGLLALANQYASNNMPGRAEDKLNELLNRYPTTVAAAHAKTQLAQLSG